MNATQPCWMKQSLAGKISLSAFSASVQTVAICVMLLAGAPCATQASDLLPFEPVIACVPHQSVHLDRNYSATAVITMPSGVIVSNAVGRLHLLGVSQESSLFLICNLPENPFLDAGSYNIRLEGINTSISILGATEEDASVVPLMRSDFLPRILLSTGFDVIANDLDLVCQQIRSIAPNGRYADYANIYLGIRDLKMQIKALCSTGNPASLADLGMDLTSLAIPEDKLKWPILFHKGHVYRMRKDKQNALNCFTSITNGIQHSIWSYNAAAFIKELEEQ